MPSAPGTSTSPTPAAHAPAKVLRASAVPTVVVGVLATAVAQLAGGGPAALGALCGLVLVLVFFTVGQVVLARILATNPEMGMTAALVLYLAKIGVLFVLLVLLANTTLFDPKAFGLTVLVCTLTWTGAEVWAMGRTRMLVVEPGTGPGVPPSDDHGGRS